MRTVAGTVPPDKHRPGKFSPRGSKLPPLPPDPALAALIADPRLGSTAKTIAVALVTHWARFKDHAWPSDKTIAAKVGRSVGHVQRCLRALEAAGYVRREKTTDNRTGRLIRLLWRTAQPSAGAQPGSAPARSDPSAPARDKQVVIVNGRIEQEVPEISSRSRPEPEVEPVAEREVIEAAPIAPSPALLEADPAPAEPPPAVGAPSAAPCSTETPRLFNLGTIGRSPVAQPRSVPLGRIRPEIPARTPAPALTSRRPFALSRDELADLVAKTGDPILAAELARLSTPRPVEPPPQTLTTEALLTKLPGRPDLVPSAAERLCLELGDFKAATWSFARKASESVSSGAVAVSVLLECLRQARSPQARDRGKVFVIAWKREGRPSG